MQVGDIDNERSTFMFNKLLSSQFVNLSIVASSLWNQFGRLFDICFCHRDKKTQYLLPIKYMTLHFFSRESDSRIANVRLSVRLSVCQSVSHQNPSASMNHAYQTNLSLSAIMPISHCTNQLLCHSATMPPPSLSLSES